MNSFIGQMILLKEQCNKQIDNKQNRWNKQNGLFKNDELIK